VEDVAETSVVESFQFPELRLCKLAGLETVEEYRKASLCIDPQLECCGHFGTAPKCAEFAEAVASLCNSGHNFRQRTAVVRDNAAKICDTVDNIRRLAIAETSCGASIHAEQLALAIVKAKTNPRTMCFQTVEKMLQLLCSACKQQRVIRV
jgi:hypothetical protein